MSAGLDIVFDPLLPWAAIGVFGLAALAVLALGIAGRAPGSVLRAGLAAAILIALANPSAVQEQRAPIKDVALLLVDETPSQETAGRLQATRAAADAMAQRLARFEDTLEVRRLTLSHRTIADGAKGTRMIDALRTALADIPTRRFAGAILITDGQVHDVPEADPATGDVTRGLPGPLHAVIVGREDASDRRLSVVEAPGYGLVGEPVTLRVRVEDPSAEAGGSARITVKLDGEPKRGVRAPIGEIAEITVTPEHRGASIIELETPERPGELSGVNNRAVLSINGVRDRLRVLLVSGQPHPGERTWRNLLKSDPSVDLVHFTILRPPEKQDGTPIHELSLIAFPTRELFELKLDEFDLVVFDRYRRRGVLPSIYLSNIVNYVQEGGALLQAVGPGFAGPYSLYRTDLGQLMPGAPSGAVVERGFTPQVTNRGRRHPVTADLPGGPGVTLNSDGEAISARRGDPVWGRWFRQIETDARSGETLMTGLDENPLLLLDRVGEGRIAQINSDHIWLWARGFEGGGPQAELLRRMAHWLMKEPELEEEDLRARVDGDRLEVRLRSLDPMVEPTVAVDLPDGTTRTLTLSHEGGGRYGAAMPIERTGLYSVREGDRVAMAAAGALNPLEMASLSATRDRLSPLIEATGGAVAQVGAGGAAVDASVLEQELPTIRRVAADRTAGGADWFGMRANADFVVTGIATQALMPGWLLLVLALGLMAAAWRRESR
jgi:hypothetical protein